MQPLILRQARTQTETAWRDVETDFEQLPAAVGVDANGLSTATSTRITEVKMETTDDR